MEITSQLLDSIAVGIVKNISSRLDGGIDINNFDVIKALLKNELSKFSPLIDSAVKDICADIRKIKLESPDNVSVNNLKDIEGYFDKLSKTIQDSLKIDIAAPSVNVNVPDVIVPEIKIPAAIVNIPKADPINFPVIDLKPILKALDENLNKLRTNDKTRPLAVRLTDGQEWIKAIQEGVKEGVGGISIQGFSDVMFLKNVAGQRINPATDEAVSTINNTLTSGITVDADIQNESIEQPTGDTHNAYNVKVAGMDTDGKVRPFKLATDGSAHVIEASASAIKDAAESADGTLVDISSDTDAIKTAIQILDNIVSNNQAMVGLNAYRSSDSTYQPARLDKATNSIQTVDYEHHEIHDGSHFFVVGYQDLAINNVLDFTFLMPNTTTWSHWNFKISAESELSWIVYETAVATNALANTITPLNSNRNSATASGTTLKYEVQADLATANTDTNVGGATIILSGIIGAGKDSGEYERGHEIILKQNTLYCLRAIATAAGFVNFDMQWYEHASIV